MGEFDWNHGFQDHRGTRLNQGGAQNGNQEFCEQRGGLDTGTPNQKVVPCDPEPNDKLVAPDLVQKQRFGSLLAQLSQSSEQVAPSPLSIIKENGHASITIAKVFTHSNTTSLNIELRDAGVMTTLPSTSM